MRGGTLPTRHAGPTRAAFGWRPAAAWGLWALTIAGVPAMVWLDRLLRDAGRIDLSLLRTSDAAAYLLAVASAATVGALLAGRRPLHPVGWLLLALAFAVVASGVAAGYAYYGRLARPGALPAAGYAAIYNGVSAPVAAACVSFILLLTPTGSPPSPRWRWVARVAAAAPAVAVVSSALLPFDPPFAPVHNPLVVDALNGPLTAVSFFGWVPTGPSMPVAAASLVVRFRRARGVERLQLRWLVLAAGLEGALVLVLAALIPTSPGGAPD